MFIIVHSGQTGVERGAHHGAVAAGFYITGFMASGKRDEVGPLPHTIAKHLTPSNDAGPRAAVRANLAIADAVLIVVPTAETAERFPAMDFVMREVRMRRLPHLICDPETSMHHVSAWAGDVREHRTACRLVVTGPRATRWQAGEEIARRLVRSLVPPM
jgi:hypothetical protein